jgi:hypothetical protein
LQDLLVSICFIFLVQKKYLHKAINLWLYLTLTIVLTVIFSQISKFGNVLFLVRYTEYLIIALSLCYISENTPPNFFYKYLLSILCCFICAALLQSSGLIPSYDTGRGFIYSTDRVASFAGNALELSYFTLCLFVILKNENNKKLFVLFILSSVLVYLSGSRFPLLLICIYFCWFMFERIRRWRKVIYILILFFLILIAFIYNYGAFIKGWGVLKEITTSIYNTCLTYNVSDFSQIKSGTIDRDLDMSFAARIVKTCSSNSFIQNSDWSMYLGYGSLSLGGAMDFGLYRIVAEFGVFSVLFFLLIFKSPTKVWILFLSINILFDGFLNSLCMPLILYYYFNLKSKKNTSRPNSTVNTVIG